MSRTCSGLCREMNDRGVSVEFIKENMSFTAGSDDPRSILMFTMLSAFAQFERSLIKERQREGIALAKAKGTVYKGRKPALNAERIAQLREQAAAGANRTKLAKEFGISRETLYQYLEVSVSLMPDKAVSWTQSSKSTAQQFYILLT